MVTNCPLYEVLQQPPTVDALTVTYGTTGVLYSDLVLAGWGVLPQRVSSVNGNGEYNTAGLTPLFQSHDFWGVMCNGNTGFFHASKTECTDIIHGPLGAVHIRYGCGADKDSGKLWILT